MTEETKDAFPQTWTELKELDQFEDLPELVQPQELKVTQSALFEVMRTRVNSRFSQLNELGLFTPGTPVKDEDRTVILLAESVDYADSFFQSIAKSKKDWEAWTKGRALADLFLLFSTLIRFYGEQLGKSTASGKRSAAARSN